MPRLLFLDWLRIAVLGLLILFHVGMVYVTWPFHIKSPTTSHTLEAFMLLSAPWRMSVLFLIGGAACWHALCKTPPESVLWPRTKRLLAPLLCGIVLIVPPQSYVEVMHKYHYAGSYAEFLKLYFAGSKQFCAQGKCLILPTWNHLWFLPYLWVYTVLLWSAKQVWSLLRLPSLNFNLKLGMQALLLLAPLGLLLLARYSLASRFPQTYDVAHDWFSHSQYIMMFMLGALFAARSDIWPMLAKWRWIAFAGALLAWVLLLSTRSAWWFSLEQWCGVLAALGFAYQWFNRDHPWRRALSEAVFPVYLFHQTWIVLLAWGLQGRALPPALEAPLLVVATVLLSALSYLLVRHLRWGRTWFGLGKGA